MCVGGEEKVRTHHGHIPKSLPYAPRERAAPDARARLSLRPRRAQASLSSAGYARYGMMKRRQVGSALRS